jgi:hypothetical protein
MTADPKASPFVRVLVRSPRPESLVTFMRAHPGDYGGRPRRAAHGWVVELYCREAEARGLAADDCQITVDDKFFERMQKARLEEEKSRVSPEARAAAVERGELPTTQRGKFPPRRGR